MGGVGEEEGPGGGSGGGILQQWEMYRVLPTARTMLRDRDYEKGDSRIGNGGRMERSRRLHRTKARPIANFGWNTSSVGGSGFKSCSV